MFLDGVLADLETGLDSLASRKSCFRSDIVDLCEQQTDQRNKITCQHLGSAEMVRCSELACIDLHCSFRNSAKIIEHVQCRINYVLAIASRTPLQYSVTCVRLRGAMRGQSATTRSEARMRPYVVSSSVVLCSL